jgi:hypothetical protein
MRLSGLFGRVNDQSVDEVIAAAAYGWFAVAVLQVVMAAFAALAGTLAGGDLVDPVVSALGGAFLRSTKSRALAAALLLYAIVTAVLCLAKFLGLAGNGVPLATSIIALFAGWRGLAATRFWQKRACALPAWRPVAVGATMAVVVTLVSLLVMLGLTGEAPAGWREFLTSAVLFLVPAVVLIWFTRRRRFTTNDPACLWPPKS